MGECTNCSGKSGCDQRKTDMFSQIDAALEQLYPNKSWGRPVTDDSNPHGIDRYRSNRHGIDEVESQELAAELAVALKASTFFRRGDDDEWCDYIYILCLGREPCLVQLRDAQLPCPQELDNGAVIDELYLRICLSRITRFAAIQQVAICGELERSESGVELFVTESPRAGVYDAPLLARFRKAVSAISDWGILHVDFGEITNPPQGYDPAGYAGQYGGTPTVANYLFYPQPATMIVSEWVALATNRLR